MLVVANMIGVGVFTTSGYTLGDLGTPGRVLAAWAVGGVLALLGALSYGALARRMPASGGEYLFLSRTFHPLAGFLAGWVSLLAGFTAPIALAALGLAAYLSPWIGDDVSKPLVATLAVLLAGCLHGFGLRAGVLVQNLVVAVKLVLLVAFVVFGAAHIPSLDRGPAPDPGPFDLGLFCVSLVWIYFSYSGWNAAVYVAGEVRDPDRNLPRSLWGGALVVCAVYLGLNAVFVYSAPPADLAYQAQVGAVAAAALGGPGLERALSALVVIALATSVSAMVMMGPRVYARMAEDGLMPAFLAKGDDVPRSSIALQVCLAVVVIWIASLRELLGYVGFTLSLSAAATICSLFVLRRREGAQAVPVPGYPWVPLLFVIPTVFVAGYMALREPMQALRGVLTVALGIPIYFGMRRSAGRK
ncbi:MAG: amino acid permease, partial [Planctomycetota bacterium]